MDADRIHPSTDRRLAAALNVGVSDLIEGSESKRAHKAYRPDIEKIADMPRASASALTFAATIRRSPPQNEVPRGTVFYVSPPRRRNAELPAG